VDFSTGGVAEAAQEVYGSVSGVVYKSLYMSNLEDTDIKVLYFEFQVLL